MIPQVTPRSLSHPSIPLHRAAQVPWVEGPTRVLVAEDDDEMRALIVEALCARGYHVIEASNGPELRDWLHRSQVQEGFEPPPDLIISDVRMPGASGLEVLTWLRQRDWSTPVILITAFGDPDTHHEAERLGATIFNKPLSVDSLVFAARVLAEPR